MDRPFNSASTSSFFHRPEETLPTAHEQQFNNGIREITVLALLGLFLCLGSYAFLRLWQRRERDEEFLPYSWEDEIVYRTGFALCAFSLAVSLGSALLLPISTISNEVLHKYPSSWYIKWLNSSLIDGIWNLIFLLSNVSLFVLLPFAYLFCESEGLPFFGHKKGLLARAKETLVTLMLLFVIVLGFMYVIAALIDRDSDSLDRLLNVYSHLPFLYSCVSFVGVLMLLVCTPLGFAKLFTIVGDLVVKPTFMRRNLDEEFYVARFEEDSLRQRIDDYNGGVFQRITPVTNQTTGQRLSNGDVLSYYQKQLSDTSQQRQSLDRARRTPIWRRYLGYPLVMLVLFALTFSVLVLVFFNAGQIMVGFRALPSYQPTVDLGLTSLSHLGLVGVIIEVVLIGYLLLTSLVGLYTIPVVSKIRPTLHDTSLTQIILNCAILVVLSSALPLLSKILGITNFDLLGSFGKVMWLGNLYLVLFYNVVFFVATGLCLIKNFTSKVMNEIWNRISLYISTVFKPNADSKSASTAKTLGGLATAATTPVTTAVAAAATATAAVSVTTATMGLKSE